MQKTCKKMRNGFRIVKILVILLLLFCLPHSIYANTVFSTPEKVFDSLLKAIITRDRVLYEDCLGRPLNKEEVEHINLVEETFMELPSPVVMEINNIKILKKGFEDIDTGKVFYIYSEQTWEYGDKRKEEKKLDLHFMKKGDRWRFIPIKGQSFLFQ